MTNILVKPKIDKVDMSLRTCFRCSGRKKMYSGMGGWSLDNFGGELKDCPLCLGKGKIKKLEDLAKLDEKEAIQDEQTKAQSGQEEVTERKETKKRTVRTPVDLQLGNSEKDL